MAKTMTPLRYPGGKSKLYNYTKNLIKKNNLIGCTYVEPFAGGCGLALELLFTGVVNNVILNDIDRSIYALWTTILNDNRKLIDKINSTSITINEWHIQRKIQEHKETADLFELGFSTLFLNRTNYSGIIKAGPIGGQKQNGNYKLDSRFNKEDIINKITRIYDVRDKISFYNKDAIDFLNLLQDNKFKNLFIFLDPPYFEKGPGLYTNFYKEQDHINLGKRISELDNNWVVTYDNSEIIKSIYNHYNFKEYSIRYSANNNYKGTEVMFYSDNIIPIKF